MFRPLPKKFSYSRSKPNNAPVKWIHAYEICVGYEITQRKTDSLPAICSRILGYLLLNLPKDVGRDTLATRIITGDREGLRTASVIQDLGMLYLHHLLRYFRRDGLTPSNSTNCSQQMTPKDIEWYIQSTSDDIQRAEALALFRDRNRCIISGKIDLRYYNDSEEDHGEDDESDVPPLTLTQPTHIIPESVAAASGNARKNFRIVTRDLGYPKIADDVLDGSIHNLENILTLDRTLRYLFNTACLWFEPVEDVPKEYRIILAPSSGTLRRHGLRNNTTTTFSSQLPHFPGPDPDYLELHATCCKVLHLSGALKYLEAANDVVLNSYGLAPDGSSITALDYALAKLGT